MIERRISKALDYRLKDPTSIPEGGKFHSMANDEKYYLRKLRLTKSLIRYLRETLVLIFLRDIRLSDTFFANFNKFDVSKRSRDL